MLASGDSPFELDGLQFTSTPEESRAIDTRHEPCVIIAASGMCEAGRVLHHLKSSMEDARNSIVIVGFQAQHTLGRRIVERRPRVRVFGVERQLMAEVTVLNGFSAHADRDGLVSFAKALRAQSPLQSIALVHGEPVPLERLRQALQNEAFADVRVPSPNDIWTL